MMEIIIPKELQPDWTQVQQAAYNRWPARLPLYEHQINDVVVTAILGTNPFPLIKSSNPQEVREGFTLLWDFWRRTGYDTASVEFLLCDVLEGNGALYHGKSGCIKTYEDFERYPWDEIPDRFFEAYGMKYALLAETCPDGMRAVGGIGNGVFEAVQDIVGFEELCYILADDPELFEGLFAKMGRLLTTIWQRFAKEYSDVYCVLRMGDDLGYRQQTLLPPDLLRAHVLPHYKNIVNIAHGVKKPFLLHSCGCIFAIMEDIIATGINAKHSNEDQIAPFTQWVDQYGDKIGNFGGIDTDVVCRASENEIREYVTTVLDKVEGKGGIAFGSGNSIPNFVPPQNFLAMTRAVIEWREKHQRA